jgi:hypothetical protein
MENWKLKFNEELAKLTPILQGLGFSLDQDQPHISGERFLMTKEKMVLVGNHIPTNKRMVIKISDKARGKKDITDEKLARDLLQSIVFAKQNILFPKEFFWGEKDDYTIWAIEFIEQKTIFVSLPIEEQFFLALRAFEAQEAIHATTYEHIKIVKKIFPILYGQEYFKEFELSKKIFSEKYPDSDINLTLEKASKFLRSNKKIIDQYSNYLTHTDFVPHNFRVHDHQIYMLDCAPEYRTVHFGNKYEGWARFLNYMLIHNPELERLLTEYIKKNRGEEEYLSLSLMRVYKIGFLLRYYAESYALTSGDLNSLTKIRINLWHTILNFVLLDQAIPAEIIETYKQERNALRSDEEKERQKDFAQA